MILVFTSLGRSNNSETLDHNLMQCIRLGKMNQTHLVVTFVDGAEFNAAEQSELKGSEREEYRQAQAGYQKLQMQRAIVDGQKQDAFNREDIHAAKALDARLTELLRAVPEALAKISQVTVAIKCRQFASHGYDGSRSS